MRPMHTRPRCVVILLLLSPLLGFAAPNPDYGKIEVLRDRWGIPHIFSETDPGAMYGLGHATADEHGFQMVYALRIIQGRLAEVLGEQPRPGRSDTTLDSDRRVRTFGWARAAARTAARLDDETLRLLRAYCEGVNDSFESQRAAGTLHPLFARFDIQPEPWTPADCLLSWWHLAQFFATDGTRDLITRRNRENPARGRPQPPKPGALWADDETAVVRPENADPAWMQRVREFAERIGPGDTTSGEPGPKFSHTWVVGRGKSTSGAAVLVSDPQTPVRNPSLWMEFHVSGKTIEARGIGVPGSPGLLIGFTPGVAWGLTALGADQADLFLLKTDPDHPDAYFWEGDWRKMEVRTERIRVRGGADVPLTIRETHLGPVASAFCFRQPNEPEVALKRVPICETDRDTIQGVFKMMRARTATQFKAALADWRFPSANCVYGDAKGDFGYSVLGAIPIRSRSAENRDGNEAMHATRDADDWQGFVPADLLPQVFNPPEGCILSGNHRPVASFYQIPLGLSTGSMGDTMRSWRLRERLMAKDRFSPQDVLDIHFDTVNPARRDIVRLALHLRKNRPDDLSADTREALDVLGPWFEAGASSDLTSPGSELATRISTFFRFVATPLARKFGGGESGLARFLKDATARIKADPNAAFGPDELDFIDRVISDAWRAENADRRGTSARQDRPNARSARVLGWFDSLDGFGSLDRTKDLPIPGITCLDRQTIHCQEGQSYTQFVPLHDVDAAQTICPIGHSDRPDSPFRTSTMDLWAKAKLHPAPMSRPAVEAITISRKVLSKPADTQPSGSPSE